jgi:4-amino-4-deoxy-L-arabinose transferase-like glycosyltransferase
MFAMRTAGSLLHPIERLHDALIDPARRERAMALVLCGYTAVWALYGAIAKGSQDINFDMAEAVGWSRELLLGTPKHPPMSAWVAGVWFGVFPVADWAYYLLAIALAALALWIAWHVARDYLDAEKRLVGLALLTLVPFFNFHALKYNANTVQIPFWAAATWWFLRSFETRSLPYAALAGAGAAGAMLGKYWSVFLLAGLGVAALTDPRRGGYFRSAAPWLTIAVGAVLLAPHVAWIVANDFSPFNYAFAVHGSRSAFAPLQSTIGFITGTVAYLAAPLLLALAAALPGRAALADTLWPREPRRRLVLIAFAAPLVLPIIVAIIAQFEIVSLWNMAAMTLLPVILFSSPLVSVPRVAAVRVLAIAVVFPLLMLAASPVIALVIHRYGTNNATHDQLLAAAVEQAWRATTDKPLRLVGSYTVAFYLPDRPSTVDVFWPAATPWIDAARIARDGMALVCRADDAPCVGLIEARAATNPAARRSEVELSRRYMGFNDPPVRYVIIVIPPKAG